MLALLRPCLVATFAAASALAQTTTAMAVDALVCDPSGKPVAGVEFGDRWSCANTRWSATLGCNPPDQRAPLTSDAEGRPRGLWIEDPGETPLLGLSADRRLAGFVHGSYDPDTHRPQVVGRIVLQPATVLRGAMRTSAPMPADAPRSLVLGFAHPVHAGLQSGVPFGLDANTFALPLPPGTYSVTVRIGRSGATGRTATLEAGRETLDLGPISVPLVPFDLLGEVLPDWHVDRAENVALEKATLAAFRGKPLLVCFDEFGARWYPRGDTRKQLAELGQHPRRGDFQVVLFDTSVRVGSLPAEPPDEPVVERLYPLVADGTGATADRYGSRWATVVLDRDGRLVHCGSLGEAVPALERLLAARKR